jgi:hypothetical protein
MVRGTVTDPDERQGRGQGWPFPSLHSFHSGAGFRAARSSQGRAVSQARRERTLYGEDRSEIMAQGRKGRHTTTAPQQFPYPKNEALLAKIGIGEGEEKSGFIFVTEVH